MLTAITSAMTSAFSIVKTGVTSVLDWATTASTESTAGGEWIMLFMFGMPLVLIGLKAIKRITSTRV